MRVNATHWRVFLTQKLAILMKKQSRNELSLAPRLLMKQKNPTPFQAANANDRALYRSQIQHDRPVQAATNARCLKLHVAWANARQAKTGRFSH